MPNGNNTPKKNMRMIMSCDDAEREREKNDSKWKCVRKMLRKFLLKMFTNVHKVEEFHSMARASSSTHALPTKSIYHSKLCSVHFLFSFFTKKKNVHSINPWYTAAAGEGKSENINGRWKTEPNITSSDLVWRKNKVQYFCLGKCEKTLKMEKFVKSVEKSVKIL